MTEVYPIEADGGGVRMKLIFKGADGKVDFRSQPNTLSK